ncbi:hypothetical protein [Rhodococcus sp. NPDC127528]|uniref:hypothetical protein n=1 Tax=unclassified Rhodococcus (in: high G+C Gram-positive bacteria) TaxID=192944 RepID=UPI00363149AB
MTTRAGRRRPLRLLARIVCVGALAAAPLASVAAPAFADPGYAGDGDYNHDYGDHDYPYDYSYHGWDQHAGTENYARNRDYSPGDRGDGGVPACPYRAQSDLWWQNCVPQ